MSFFTSLSGLKNAETDLRVIAHNIANAETVGFKKSSAQFADLVASGSNTDPRRTAGIGATVSAITQDFALGPIEQTGRSLDLAINGDGFLAFANPVSGDLSFTRNGNLQISATGAVQDSLGSQLQAFPVDAAGNPTAAVPVDVTVPLTNAAGSALANVTINGRGTINAAYADGTAVAVGQVALATFASPTGLRAVGQTKWEASGDSGAPAFGNPGIGNYGDLISGALERSNVDLAEEMVGLLTAQRNFQANARAIDTATTISQTVINLQR
ncbi:flagellar hook protein FlgE [Erythrobacter litoralis]|jgi:flagellar hook protein FlgE|uniref:Flagellar hook protein FlgE n=1 Tax=Erythrobacter litoralis TaxID=39960 RepID=A0A074M875_9SPHN|nr:flagellar hook basal-body protein [Erythrobacter litoralis]AOL22259.1 flagellar hook protein FlgE [Erythrobacter litoralis]KEO90991.1 flagellar hook protein FlgE [Erythrobacter litoralis]